MSSKKKIYIYLKSHLPENGWLQSCFNCEQITSKCLLYETFHKNNEKYEFNVYVCGHCIRDFEKEVKLYNILCAKCNEYIDENFSFLDPG